MKAVERWFSDRLRDEITLVRWGTFGRPVLVFPSAGGDAEEILGRTFAQAGAMPAEGWGSQCQLSELDGSPMPLERMPGGGGVEAITELTRRVKLTAL